MKTLSVLLLGLWSIASAAPPVVSNIRASQRPGTKLVDIYCDLSDADGDLQLVQVAASSDAGLTYGIPCSTVDAFFMDKTEVSKELWQSVQTWGNNNGYSIGGGGWKDAGHPAHSMSWYDAVKWCNARSQKECLTPCYHTDAAQAIIYKSGNTNIENTMVKWTANGYRLPTEAEWEKAARGGITGKRFPWGDSISHSLANFYNVNGEPYQTGTTGFHPTYATGSQPYTSPVGSFAANAYGLHDMAGNVWEWTWDWHSGSFYGTPESLTNPSGPASGSYRVLRGGNWDGNANGCRVAYRNYGSPDYTYYGYGFRSVRR